MLKFEEFIVHVKVWI